MPDKNLPPVPPGEIPLILPDVATQPHPTGPVTEIPRRPADGEDDKEDDEGTPKFSLDYVRELQLEYEEQDKKGKIV